MRNTPEQPAYRDPQWWAEGDQRLNAELDPFRGVELDQLTPVVAAQIGALVAFVLRAYAQLRAIVRELATAPVAPARTPRAATNPSAGGDR